VREDIKYKRNKVEKGWEREGRDGEEEEEEEGKKEWKENETQTEM